MALAETYCVRVEAGIFTKRGVFSCKIVKAKTEIYMGGQKDIKDI